MSVPTCNGSRTVYLAGPMSGKPDCNRAAFSEAADHWRAAGWHVWSPPENEEDGEPFEYKHVIPADLVSLGACTDMALGPGWESSLGVAQELLFSLVSCDHQYYLWDGRKIGIMDMPPSLRAVALTRTNRHNDYGHPADNFRITADLVNAAGFARITPDGEVRRITALDIPAWMRMVKEARLMQSRDPDHLVDIVGYCETEHMITASERTTDGQFQGKR